jgi:pyruvate dehydrogenase E2 component (dihydrolipoamide acetyltransferase)
MATEIVLPKLGQTMEEGTIVEWVKKEGDPVGRGDVLFHMETDKAVLEVEARARGVLRKILVEPGVTVPIMTVVGIIAAENEDIDDILARVAGGPAAAQPAGPEPEPVEPGPAAEPVVTETPPAQARAAGAGGRIIASPRARRVAAERGVDLAQVRGSGPNGRIIEKDVLAYLHARPPATPLARKVADEMGVSLTQVPVGEGRLTAEAVRQMADAARAQPPAAGQVVPMAGIRGIIAEHMAASAHTTAPVTLESRVDATELVALRERLKDALADDLGFAVGYNDLLALIVGRCLVEYPYMNVRLEEGGIRHLDEVHVGLAVDTERGLLVPVIRNADRMGLKELARTLRELVGRAREGRSLPDDLTGGTFTITNLGMYGVDAFTPIINLPECAILGVGRIRPEPVVVDGQVVVRQMMWLSLTFDHRLVDGAPAARFLQGIARYIENPYLLLA